MATPTLRIVPVISVLLSLIVVARFPASASAEPRANAATSPVEPTARKVPRSLAGRVLDADGKPAAGASVFITQPVQYPAIDILGRGTTGNDGNFSIEVKPAATGPDVGRAKMFAVLPTVGFSTVRPFDGESTMEFRLLPSAELHVPFVGPDDKPIVGMRVWPGRISFRDDTEMVPESLDLPDEVAQLWAARTDEQGVCVFRALPRAARVLFDDDDPRMVEMTYNEIVPLERPGVIEAPPIHLKLAATISGMITYSDSGKPVSGMKVYAESLTHDGGGMGQTDAGGRYQIGRVNPGRYVVVIDLEQHEPSDWTAHAAQLDVASGERATADLVMIHGGLITGRVRDQQTHKGSANMEVALHGPSAPAIAGGVAMVVTNSEGVYRMRVPPGRQSIYLMSEPPAGYMRPDANPFHVHELAVRDAEIVSYDIDLPLDKSPAITGIVLGPDGKPVAGATVLYLIDKIGNMERTVLSGADGRFQVRHVLHDGNFRARFKHLATLSGVPLPPDNRELVLKLSERASYSLLVRVKDTEGKAMAGASVELTTMLGPQGYGSQPHPTDAGGTVRFDTLYTDTTYDVSATGGGSSAEFTAVQPPQAGAPREQVIELKIRAANSSVSGIVVDEKGNPVAGAQVRLGTPGSAMQTTTTDAKGRFKFAVVSGMRGYLYLPAMTTDKGIPMASTAEAGDSDLRLVLVSIPKARPEMPQK
jgi:hypothetical protein